MFSLVVPTCKGFETLKPLFLTSSPDAEIIIIDSNYNLDTKQKLEQIQHNYEKITYAPPRPKTYPYDMMNAINTGTAYSEHPWIIKIDDNWELKPDFFIKAKQTIKHFTRLRTDHFVIRPIELEPWNNDTKWKSFIPYTNRYFTLPQRPLGRPIPIQTIGQAIYHINSMYELNGWDERYDQGGPGWTDNDMYYRLLTARYLVILDQQLMVYRYPHKSTGTQDRKIGEQTFRDILENELKKGLTKTHNPFSMKELHQQQLKTKNKYIINSKISPLPHTQNPPQKDTDSESQKENAL